MFPAILEAPASRREDAMVIGDNPESDIAGAHRAGIPAILVLTGVTDATTAADPGGGAAARLGRCRPGRGGWPCWA